MINAHDAMNSAMGGAKTAVDSATGAAKTAAAATAAAATAAATNTKGLALGAAMGAMHLLKLARNLEADDLLGLVGLMRRRSNPLGSILLLGGGIAIGAGIGMLLAPVSGREARNFLLRGLGLVTDKVETLQDRATEVVGEVQQKAGQVVEQVQEKAGEIAGQVQDKAAQIMDQGAEAGGQEQAEGETEGEGRKGGRRARSNHNTHLS